jgi:hypothetical protein
MSSTNLSINGIKMTTLLNLSRKACIAFVNPVDLRVLIVATNNTLELISTYTELLRMSMHPIK